MPLEWGAILNVSFVTIGQVLAIPTLIKDKRCLEQHVRYMVLHIYRKGHVRNATLVCLYCPSVLIVESMCVLGNLHVSVTTSVVFPGRCTRTGRSLINNMRAYLVYVENTMYFSTNMNNHICVMAMLLFVAARACDWKLVLGSEICLKTKLASGRLVMHARYRASLSL